MSFPAFLLLLPLIVVPILMHLISRKKLKKIEFPTLLFFVKNEVKFIRWFRLKRLLLLLVRISLLVFLIFAAANLKIPFKTFDLFETVIVDNSPSMRSSEMGKKNAFIVPDYSGIPQFSLFLKKYPIGILITDAQKNGFSEILRKGEKFPGIRISRKDLPPGNLGIVGGSLGPAFEGENFIAKFKILNEYNEKKRTLLVLKSKNRIIDKKEVVLKEGENLLSSEIKLSKGLYALSLELEDKEGFIFDNKFYFVLNVRKKENVCILSDSFPERLMAALSNDYFKVRWVSEPSDVDGDLFFACDLEEQDISDLIHGKVPGIFCLQGKTNSLFSNKIPEKISPVIEESFLGDPLYLKNLKGIPIRYNSIITEGETIMYFENGDPFLSRIKNHLILPISPEKNDFSLHPVFIPFLFSLIDFLSDNTIHANVLSDEKIVMYSEFRPVIIDPGGFEYKPRPMGESRYIFEETERVGIYRVMNRSSLRGLIAVNTHPSESEIESLSDEEITYIFGKQSFFNGTSFFLVVCFLCFALSVLLERTILRVQ